MSMLALAADAVQLAAQSHGEASSSGLPQLNPAWWPSQIFWLAVTFGALYWLMSSYFLPRIGGMIEERRDRIADDLDQAAEFKQQAEEAQNAYEKALADARAKAQAIAADTRAGVDAEIAAMQAEMEKTLAADVAAAEERIVTMKADAAETVREAAVETARAIVETLIDEAPTSEAVTAAVASVKA
ncbi:MAG: F0F1 ATP synthase subunit B' [Parvularculaceae bacterium]